MDAQARYRLAQEAARDGRHEEALRGYIWFHEHALEQDRSLYGVRLSFALSDWLELAKAYPPALVALTGIRDTKTQRLLEGVIDRALFHDVESINESLEDYQSTYDLFVRLNQDNPSLARECVGLAMPAIVNVKDFVLARAFVSDPEADVRRWSSALNEDVADLANEPPREAPVLEAYVHIYARRVNLLLTVLDGVGEQSRAQSLREAAVAFVESEPAREAVKAALAGVSPSFGEQTR